MPELAGILRSQTRTRRSCGQSLCQRKTAACSRRRRGAASFAGSGRPTSYRSKNTDAGQSRVGVQSPQLNDPGLRSAVTAARRRPPRVAP